MRVLLVEDHAALAEGLKQDLQRAGFAVDWAACALDGAHLGREIPYDCVILDLGLPDGNGLDLLRQWRRLGQDLPVLVLTAWDAWYQRVDGFKAGADDYLGKPFHVEELIARVHALIRRRHAAFHPMLKVQGLSLDEERQELHVEAGGIHPLTRTEFRLLRLFLLHPDQVLSKTRLTEHAYDQDSDRDSNVIEVYINRLRRLVGKERIVTRRGQGYLLKEKP
ncbi:MAG: response regulator transcription factor [Magnetococcus sp. WYHC-3]